MVSFLGFALIPGIKIRDVVINRRRLICISNSSSRSHHYFNCKEEERRDQKMAVLYIGFFRDPVQATCKLGRSYRPNNIRTKIFSTKSGICLTNQSLVSADNSIPQDILTWDKTTCQSTSKMHRQ